MEAFTSILENAGQLVVYMAAHITPILSLLRTPVCFQISSGLSCQIPSNPALTT